MGEWLFQTDAYVKGFEARVIATEGNAVALDRTAFYPGGGGQPPDRGFFYAGEKTWQVVTVRKVAEEIWHEVTGEPHPPG